MAKRPLALAAVLFAACFVAIAIAKVAMGTWQRDGWSVALGGSALMTVAGVGSIYGKRNRRGEGHSERPHSH